MKALKIGQISERDFAALVERCGGVRYSFKHADGWGDMTLGRASFQREAGRCILRLTAADDRGWIENYVRFNDVKRLEVIRSSNAGAVIGVYCARDAEPQTANVRFPSEEGKTNQKKGTNEDDRTETEDICVQTEPVM